MFNEHGLSVAVIATLTITNVQYDEKLPFGLGEMSLGPPSLPTVSVRSRQKTCGPAGRDDG